MENHVVQVNEQDEPLGTVEKTKAHQLGVLHRAFSVFILNSRREMLLQKRSEQKYHSGGLWSNACCSHPYPGESLEDAAHRRLREELGFDCRIRKKFSFKYQAKLDHGFMEHEIDHVFLGCFDGPLHPDPLEISEYTFLPLGEIRFLCETKPEWFTIWFHPAFYRLDHFLKPRTLRPTLGFGKV